jgi:hypothetical protein
MALDLRTPTATNFNLFDTGDSIFKSVTLIDTLFECLELINKSIREHNLDNILQYPEASLTYDDNSRTASFDVKVPYKKVAGAKVAVTYLDPYAGWIIPTTGELAGKVSLLDAYVYLVDSITYVNDKLQESPAIKVVKDLMTFTDDNNANTYTTAGTMPYNSVTSATGIIQKIGQNYPLFLDMQEGLPLA